MVIEVQYPEAASLLWAMLRELPQEVQSKYCEQVAKTASTLSHPSAGNISCTIGCDSADEPPIAQ